MVETPATIPYAHVAELLRRDQSTISRMATRHRWTFVTWPGRERGKHISLSLLEELYGLHFTAQDVAAAAKRHEDALRRSDAWQKRVARAAGVYTPPSGLSAAIELFSSTGASEDRPASGPPDVQPPEH